MSRLVSPAALQAMLRLRERRLVLMPSDATGAAAERRRRLTARTELLRARLEREHGA